MYEIFEKLLEEKGVTAYRVAKETGIQNSTFTDWKMGRSVPKLEKLSKIADYFGVSIDYLMGIEKRLVPGDDRLFKLANIPEDMIDTIIEASKKGYTANDIKTALTMLELARGKK